MQNNPPPPPPPLPSMHEHHFKLGGFHLNKAIIIPILLFVIGAVAGLSYAKSAQPQKAVDKQKITVIGKGSITTSADTVRIAGSVDVKSTDETAAVAEATKDVKELKSALSALGIPDSAITTQTVYAYPDYNYGGYSQTESKYLVIDPSATPTPIPTYTPPSYSANGYRAQTAFDILLTGQNYNLVEKTLKKLEELKYVKNVYPAYSLEEKGKFESEARQKAIEDARTQAEQIAKVNQVKLGKVLTIEEQNLSDPYKNPYPDYSNYGYGQKIVKLTTSYKVVYELEQSNFPFGL